MMLAKLLSWWKAGAATTTVVAIGLAVAGGLDVSSGLDVPEAGTAQQDPDRTDFAEVALRVEGMT
jgi:hypothetical protein